MSRIPQGSTSPGPLVATPRASARRTAVRLRSVPKRQRPRVDDEQHHLIGEELFRDAIARELKQADRFEEAFVLLLISFDAKSNQPSRSAEIVEALTATKLDTDVIGWFEQGSAVGLIRPLAHLSPTEAATSLAATVHRELARSLSSESASSCSIRLDVYSPHGDGMVPVLLDATKRRQPSARDFAKRLLDIAGSSLLLVALSPVFLFVSILVKLTSDGPVFFRQERVGQLGRPFTMLKFRTMHVGADESIHKQYVTQFIQASAPVESGTTAVFKIVDDPRITPVGHFLRRSSLDELPQFWNVLKGEMSLVGPRPPLAYEVARYKRWHRRRVLEVKPGITGLWQVTGRSTTTFDEMVRLDLRYAKTYSLWTDLKILLATPRAVVSGRGAH